MAELDAETCRLEESAHRVRNWQRWGTYLPERQWGTVREDYSDDSNVWEYFPHDHARSRAYRWGEDGLLGWCDRECRLCFGLALWNGKDPILKERLFGLNHREGNHGEDIKECYYYLDATPTAAYARGLYKYPQAEFPYNLLLTENARRGYGQPEFELLDTGVFEQQRYFDVFIEYAKRSPNDSLIRITVVNHGPEAAPLWLLPTVWFRNTWAWGCKHEGCWRKPRMSLNGEGCLETEHQTLEPFRFAADAGPDGKSPQWIFTENETNTERLYGQPHYTPYVKDAFHRYIVNGEAGAVNPKQVGTKAAALYKCTIEAGAKITLNLRMFSEEERPQKIFGGDYALTFEQRAQDSELFYAAHFFGELTPEQKLIKRQAYAGLLWSKQFYQYIVADWLDGDPDQPRPAEQRKHGRNHDWRHVYINNVLSMPDKWEYPWFASWDMAFHCILMAELDPVFAKDQLELMLREWFMHPNGQMAAYEFNFSDVNPPVIAYACWRVYKIADSRGNRDTTFLRSTFHKLLMNFTWWVNRKDPEGRNIFSGGFLGLDNIGVFDRSANSLPGELEQADGTAWMAFFCTTMLAISLELASDDPTYEDIASKFFEHFVMIADAINELGGTGLWHEGDGFYYDKLLARGEEFTMRVRSLVGLIPLLAVEVLKEDVIEKLPGFRKRMEWFLLNRPDLARHVAYLEIKDHDGKSGGVRRLLAIPSRERLLRVLGYLLNEQEFLSPFGIRSLSKFHREHPFVFTYDGQVARVEYTPAESDNGMFGGNSNWRGPVWIPVNYLLCEALDRYHYYYGDDFKVECPSGSGKLMTLREVSREIAGRLEKIFLRGEGGRRPLNGADGIYASDPAWRDLVLFYEYFCAESGRGCGASHQTGWTALIARWVEQMRTGGKAAHDVQKPVLRTEDPAQSA